MFMAASFHTQWQGTDLQVLRNEQEIDRLPAHDIRRVILVCRRGGQSPGDLAYAVIETTDHHVLLPASSGIAGRVHFERQAFWQQRPCIYWVDEAAAALPRRLRPGLWVLKRLTPDYARLPREELISCIEQWPLEGPQTWEQRKWERIVRSRQLVPGHAQSRR
jgi:hypothetical protein